MLFVGKLQKTSKTLISKRRTLRYITIWLTFRTTRLTVNTDSPRDNRSLINGSPTDRPAANRRTH